MGYKGYKGYKGYNGLQWVIRVVCRATPLLGSGGQAGSVNSVFDRYGTFI